MAISLAFLRKHYKIVAVTGLLLLLIYIFCLPRQLFDPPYSVVLEDSQGQLLAAKIASDGQWRFPALDSPPDKYIQALLVFEDRRFYQHPGVDLRALARALRQNIRSGRVVSGGSTISMQVIRLAQQNPPRTIWNKCREVILATRLEWRYTKAEILQLYAGHAPFGGNVIGLDAASWRYFGKSAGLLSWAEASTLAVLPNSPGLIHPGRNREALRQKRDRLLYRLRQKGLLNDLDLELALAEPLPQQPLPLPQLAPHLLQRLAKAYESGTLPAPRIRTHLQGGLQTALNQKVQQHQEVLRDNLIHNAAVIILHLPTNRVLAYVGNTPGAGAEHGEQVDIITAPRSTGSILKPFLYARAMEAGTILPRQFLSDTPIDFNGYRPENFNKDYQGLISADEALSRSLNIPFVNLLKAYGLERFHRDLRQLGLSTLRQEAGHYGLTLVLGGAEATLEEITMLYAKMGQTLNFFLRHDGRYPAQALPGPVIFGDSPTTQALSREPVDLGAGAAWWTLSAMQEVKRPDSEGDWEVFRAQENIAWKTGTSFGFRDAWAIGVSKEYAVGVWVGNADGEGRPGLVGVRAAAPLMFDVFRLLPQSEYGSNTAFEIPYDDMLELPTCAVTGMLANLHCPVDTIWAPKGIRSYAQCTYHQRVQLDAGGQWRVNTDCASPFAMQQRTYLVLPALQSYYYRRFHPEYELLPPWSPECRLAAGRVPMELIYPRDSYRIYVPRDLNGDLSRTVFEVAHDRSDATLFWHLDERFVGETQQFHSLELNPTQGPHQLVIVDDQGYRLEKRFEIIGREE